jgi:hypothetical protein
MKELILYLIPILCQVESGNDPKAIGDHGLAVGILQIHSCVISDVNDSMENHYYTMSDRFNARISRTICLKYLTIYGNKYKVKTGKEPTLEVLARIWNGGPDGWKKDNTNNYWLKVKKLMESNNDN